MISRLSKLKAKFCIVMKSIKPESLRNMNIHQGYYDYDYYTTEITT